MASQGRGSMTTAASLLPVSWSQLASDNRSPLAQIRQRNVIPTPLAKNQASATRRHRVEAYYDRWNSSQATLMQIR